MNPGWKSSEFWITSLTQIVAALAALGLVSAGDKDTLGGAIANGVTAAFALIASAVVIVRYIAQRAELKIYWLDSAPESSGENKPPDVGSRPTLPPIAPACFLLAVAAWLLAGPAQAQQPAQPAGKVTQTASLFGWREGMQIEALKAQLDRQQQENADLRAQLGRMEAMMTLQMNGQRSAPQVQAPAPQVVIIPLPQQGPQQQLPIAGPPPQQLPIAGPPQQQLPIAGPPIQQLPIQGAPQQQLPQQGLPQQMLPIAGGPPGQVRPQGLPLPGEARPQPLPQTMPPADALPQGPPRQQLLPTGPPQRYTPAIARR